MAWCMCFYTKKTKALETKGRNPFKSEHIHRHTGRRFLLSIILRSRRYLAVSEDIFDYHIWGVRGCYWLLDVTRLTVF